jgi:hypothetical protein
VIDDFFYSWFVFSDRIRFISDTIFLISESHTSETILTRETLLWIEHISRMKYVEAVESITHLDSSQCLETPFRTNIHIGAIHHIFYFDTELDVFTIFRIWDIIALVTIFWIDDKISDAVFRVEDFCVFDREGTHIAIEVLMNFYHGR